MRMLFKILNVFKETEYWKEGQNKRKSGKEHQKIKKTLNLNFLKFLIPM